MIKYNNTLGTISITNDYFSNLVSIVAQSCYGVADMATKNKADTLNSLLFGKRFKEKGIKISEYEGKLIIDVYINVTYGINISAVVKSISHKIKYAVEDATNLTVHKVNIFVVDIK